MTEWTIVAVLKTVVARVTVGSNPTPTAIEKACCRRGARVVESGCLLSSYGLTAIMGSNPILSAIFYDAPVAQRIRASDYGSEGRGFESSPALIFVL